MKFTKLLTALLVLVLVLASCSSGSGNESSKSSKSIDDLRVVFVPSRDAKDIEKQTEPIKQLLIDELAKSGYEVKKVSINTLTSYEAAGEALSSGSAEIGFVPGGTYAEYFDKGVKVVLASTRNGLVYDSENPKDFNTGEANANNDEIVTYYRGIIVAGPSEVGQKLSTKVNNGEKLTWEDVSEAVWCVQSPTSGSGYQYPALWLKDNFGKTFVDMAEGKVVEGGGYGGAANKLALGQCDVAPGYNDFRMDNVDAWATTFGKENIWKETQVIGVTDKIQNDTISVSAQLVDDEFAKAIADAFVNLAKTPEGAEAIKIYNHKGYAPVTDAEYEGAKKVNQLVKELQ